MDRFVRGFIIGAVASGIKDILSWLDYFYLHFTDATYAHLMGIVLFGRKPVTISELILSQTVEVMFEGFLGVVFIYFAYKTASKKNLWFKGIFFANAVYFSTFAIGSLYKLPVVYSPSVGTNASTLITSTIYGIFMGLGVYWWGKRLGEWDTETVSQVTKEQLFNIAPEPARKRERE